MEKIKFVLNTEVMYDDIHIEYQINGTRDRYFCLSKREDHITLSCFKFDEKDYVFKKMCQTFNISVLKKQYVGNPYWRFYTVDCDWNQFVPDINKYVRENRIADLEIELASVPTDYLQEIINRRLNNRDK